MEKKTDICSVCPVLDGIVNKFSNLERLTVSPGRSSNYSNNHYFLCDILMQLLFKFDKNENVRKNLKYVNITFAKSSLYEWIKDRYNSKTNAGRKTRHLQFQFENLQHVGLGIRWRGSVRNNDQNDSDTPSTRLVWEIISSIFGIFNNSTESGKNDSCNFNNTHGDHVEPLAKTTTNDSKQSKIKTLTLNGWDEPVDIRTMDICNSVYGANLTNLQCLRINGDTTNINVSSLEELIEEMKSIDRLMDRYGVNVLFANLGSSKTTQRTRFIVKLNNTVF